MIVGISFFFLAGALADDFYVDLNPGGPILMSFLDQPSPLTGGKSCRDDCQSRNGFCKKDCRITNLKCQENCEHNEDCIYACGGAYSRCINNCDPEFQECIRACPGS